MTMNMTYFYRKIHVFKRHSRQYATGSGLREWDEQDQKGCILENYEHSWRLTRISDWWEDYIPSDQNRDYRYSTLLFTMHSLWRNNVVQSYLESRYRSDVVLGLLRIRSCQFSCCCGTAGISSRRA